MPQTAGNPVKIGAVFKILEELIIHTLELISDWAVAQRQSPARTSPCALIRGRPTSL
jgi:hypothetical protein